MNMAIQEIMDAAPDPQIVSAIRLMASSVAGVKGIEKCRVRKSGLSHLVDIHVVVHPMLTVREGHVIAHAVQDALLHSSLHIIDVAVHIEPAELETRQE